MTSFTAESVHFPLNIDLSDSIHIKSFRQVYNVFYSNATLAQLLHEIYVDGDFVFIDRNVYNIYVNCFTYMNHMMVFDAREDNKTIESSLSLIDKLYETKFDRRNKMIVIGGGITQDVGGFAAAIYKRGIKWAFIPTTFLSMSDSCIGGKTSINRKSKNMLGVFAAPNAVYISDNFLLSLSPDDIISGVGESLKLSLIGGERSYRFFIEQYTHKNYMNIIKMSSIVKKLIIEYDEFDENVRRVLNYGHTIGHALECASDYFIPHGIAVLIGMYLNNILFYGDKYSDINGLILDMVCPKYVNIDFNYSSFIQHIIYDKKNNGNQVCFIVLEDIGKTSVIFKNLEDILEPLQRIMTQLFVNMNI